MIKFRFQDLKIWQLAIEIADELFDIAEKLETINYEVPCIISNRVPRVYMRSGKMVELQNPLLQND